MSGTLFRDSNVDQMSRDGSQNFSMQRYSTTQHSETEFLIDHLYPAWKTLVNLLNNDSLVRFKMGHEGKTYCKESEIRVIPTISNVF